MNDGDVWITFYSINLWDSPQRWDRFLIGLESILGDRLAKLDQNDPVRRNADTKQGEGSYVVQFGEREDSRWVFGKFAKTKVEMEIWHYRTGQDSFGRICENMLTLHVPEKLANSSSVLVQLFQFGNEQLAPFYAYADRKDVICSKKPSTPSLDISRELLGVFWLTFFGAPYGAFFGRQRLLELAEASEGPVDGITIQLATSPDQVSGQTRNRLEQELGSQSFAGSGGSKERGQYVLTLSQLLS